MIGQVEKDGRYTTGVSKTETETFTIYCVSHLHCVLCQMINETFHKNKYIYYFAYITLKSCRMLSRIIHL